MRISDWSSDVCSSDLVGVGRERSGDEHQGSAETFDTQSGEPDVAEAFRNASYRRRPALSPAGTPASSWSPRSRTSSTSQHPPASRARSQELRAGKEGVRKCIPTRSTAQHKKKK